MFKVNDDFSIYLTRGDAVAFTLAATTDDGGAYQFRAGETVRFKVFAKKACMRVVLEKDFKVEQDSETIGISLTGEETKIGDYISKPTDYWYEVELNPGLQPQTIIGYDDDGAKLFRLYPEGGALR